MTSTLTPGTRVRFTAERLGTMRPDTGNRFAEPCVGSGDLGTIADTPGPLPDGWLLVQADLTDADGSVLYVPVHPDMIEAV